VAIPQRILALAAPFAVGYRCEPRDVHGGNRALRFHGDPVAWISPDGARHSTAAEPAGAFLGDDLTDSAVFGAHEWAAGERAHSGNDESTRTGRYARPHSRLFWRRARTTWNARWFELKWYARCERSFRTVHEAADSRAAPLRPGSRCSVLKATIVTLSLHSHRTMRRPLSLSREWTWTIR
jgi:hypothetical protein